MTDIICSGCLGMLSDEEYREARTPCCDREFLVGVDYSQYDLDVDIFRLCLINSNREKAAILKKVKALPSDSKKRRQGYINKPTGDAAWPGFKGESYKRKRKSPGKSDTPPKSSSNETYVNLPINSSNDSGWTVEITGKIKNTLYGQDRAEARKKARSYLRGIGSSITTADNITEEGNKTIIHYEK